MTSAGIIPLIDNLVSAVYFNVVEPSGFTSLSETYVCILSIPQSKISSTLILKLLMMLVWYWNTLEILDMCCIVEHLVPMENFPVQHAP